MSEAADTILSIQNTVRWHSDCLVVRLGLGTPGQTKVSGDRQRETIHEICCLAAKFIKELNPLCAGLAERLCGAISIIVITISA